jgi:alkylhydroperoxidase/carboxymuconolactone decarboxylase family protein YurZ
MSARAATFLAAAFVASGSVLAQPESAATNTQSQLTEQRRQAIADLEREIQAIESREGPNSAQLIDPLSSMGSIYQGAGEHLLATAAIERARHVVRVNSGLYALEQAPLLRRLIQSADALGAVETAWELEQELLHVAERHPDTLQTAQILHETADRRIEMQMRYSGLALIDLAAALGCETKPPDYLMPQPVHNPACPTGLASDAENYYLHSLYILLQNEPSASDDRPIVLRKLLRTIYMFLGDNFAVERGDRALRDFLAYQAKNAEPLHARIDTLVQIADWGLLDSDYRKSDDQVLAVYQQAYDLLEAQPAGDAALEQFFAPAIPVVLPAFLDNPLASEQTPATTGHVDIAFEITKYGEARDVEILDSTSNATRADKQRLAQFVLRSLFRPRVTNGRLTDSDRIVVRYYLGE